MPWVKLTDDWYDDEDMAGASPLAIAMWAVAVTWSARNLTDGRIPRSQVRKLLDLEHETLVGANCRADDIAAELVELGKWTASDRGYVIRNYHRYQPTRSKVLADREKDRKRKPSRSGDLLDADTSPDGIRPESDPNPACPVPVPAIEFSRRQSSLNSTETSPPVDNPDDGDIPAAVWDTYAQLKLDAQRPGSVDNPTRWKRRVRTNAQLELIEQALTWWRMFDITPQRLAAALVDGRAPQNAPRRPEEPTDATA